MEDRITISHPDEGTVRIDIKADSDVICSNCGDDFDLLIRDDEDRIVLACRSCGNMWLEANT